MACFLSVFFCFFLLRYLFLSVFFLTDTSDSRDYREARGSPYFSCFPLPAAHEHSFSSSRFLPLLINRSICNYNTDSWWDLFSWEICIFIDAIKSELLTLTFPGDIARIWAHIKLSITLLLQSKHNRDVLFLYLSLFC